MVGPSSHHGKYRLLVELAVFLAFQRLGRQTGDEPLEQTPRHIAPVRELVGIGRLGYWLFVGDKHA